MKVLKTGFFTLLLAVCCRADTYVRQPSVDVIRYEISLELSDASDSITGLTKIHVLLRKDGVSGMWLDFEDMIVDRLRVGGVERPYEHSNGRLRFRFEKSYSKGETALVEVQYHGRSLDGGMVVGKNKYGRRVFFSDNWPDRAHHWFPSIDHPSDKALVDFTVTAPEKYDVVANGRLVQTASLTDGRKITRWHESKPIPTYCMAVGAAEFCIAFEENRTITPIQWYVYPQDFKTAAGKFSRTVAALRFFSNLIGPYSYEKLAQVQSTTRYGGMENASAIFYNESLFQGLPFANDPVPHEIAHQWFGDSVTEADWDHLWLSEGFATYFEALFYEKVRGPEALRQSMERASKLVREYPFSRSRAVIDPELVDIGEKLNPLNYQKGAWVLHMLRGILGDDKFFEGIRRYFDLYKDRTVLTGDFEKVMETTSGTDLSTFFRQWLYQPGWPEYKITWRWIKSSARLRIRIKQIQTTGLFDMPVEIAVDDGRRREKQKFRIAGATESFYIPLAARPELVEFDPDGWVLKTASVTAE